jgi:hypothetical protein
VSKKRSKSQLYLRVLPRDPSATLEQVSHELARLAQAHAFSLLRPPEPHPRGGFSLFLELPAERQPALVGVLSENDLPVVL